MNADIFRHLINLYPPYWGTGISITKISPDYRELHVQMKMRFYNRNYVKTHFGGSLYSMTDPFYMLMLIQVLGRGYVVWDKKASIDFIKPGRNRVTAGFVISDDDITDIKKNTSGGEKYLKDFFVDILDESGDKIALVVKTLYIRKKQQVV